MCLKKEQESKRNESMSSVVDRVKSSLPTMNKHTLSHRPSPVSFKAEPSPVASASSRPPNATTRPLKKAKTLTPPLNIDASQSGSRRSTINSITAPSPVYGGRLPAPNAEIKIPDPPSRSPSPPTNLVLRGRGYKYTTEDREFFVKFIGWRLKQDPTLTRLDICNLLAEKVCFCVMHYIALRITKAHRPLIIPLNLGPRIGPTITMYQIKS